MGGLRHVFVAGLRADKEVESVMGNGRFQPLHMVQADENWCGPWSLIQAGLLLHGWRRRVAGDPNTARAPWHAFWSHVRADCNDGADEADLAVLAELLGMRIDITRTSNARRIGEIAANAIERGHVPMVRTTTARWSHWQMISGISLGADGAPVALLLLDTSIDAPWAVPYNACQELHPSKPAQTEFRYEGRSLDGLRWRACFNSVVIVRRAVEERQS